mmetsp:Transcript_26050/g.56528  ORF Transcript_26050/g.56528 Transcript_26050/m.56528 type:complete len:587 (-) Transcript_26050:51-1811(-)
MSSFPQRRHYSHAGQPSEDRWAAPRDNYHQDPQSYGRGGAGGSYDDQSLDDRFSRGVSEVSSLLDPRIDQHRLREDTRYMLQAICGKFQEVDTYHRGLITSAGFSHALQACGLRYGQPEVDKILSYCNVTEDGYVMYKELLTALGPAAPRAKQSSANLAIFPQNSADDMSEYSAGAGYQDSSCSSAAYQAEITPTTNLDVIRKVYAKWERGFLPDSEFKRELIGLGCRPTAELDRLLLTYGPSRSMPFSKLMYALQADENDGRRARNHHEVRSETGSVASSRFHGQDEARQADNASSRTEEMRQLICGFVDGMVPSVSFRRGLNQLSVEFSPELDRLIRIHESDNSVRFADFARLLLRQASSSSNHRGMDDSRDTGWGAGGGSFGGRGGGLGAFARGCGAMEEGQRFTPSEHNAKGPAAASEGARGSRQRNDIISWDDGKAQGSAAASQESKPAPESRRGSCYQRDIISWDHGKDVPPNPPLVPRRPEQEDFLQWASGARAEHRHDPRNAGDVNVKLGKRYFTPGPTAAQAAPFGREADVYHGGPAFDFVTAAPFGTEADRWRRPEDAGTEEYRSAQQNRRPGALY